MQVTITCYDGQDQQIGFTRYKLLQALAYKSERDWRHLRLSGLCPNETRHVVVALRRDGATVVEYANLRVQFQAARSPLHE